MAGLPGERTGRGAPADGMEGMLHDAAHRLRVKVPSRLSVTTRPLTEAYFRTTARGGELRVVVNEVFEDAPPEVLEGLAEVIVAKASGRVGPRSVGRAFWDHVATDELRGRMQETYLARQRSFSPDPVGIAWDLRRVFESVNEDHFEGDLPRPMLGWTRRPITYRWGWFSSMVQPHGLIVINVLLDDPVVPRFVLEGTMHHEMLHMMLDPETVNGRRVVHTRTFRELEREFPSYDRLRPEYRKVLRRYGQRVRVNRGGRGKGSR